MVGHSFLLLHKKGIQGYFSFKISRDLQEDVNTSALAAPVHQLQWTLSSKAVQLRLIHAI